MEELLLEIIKCPNFTKGPVEGHPCCEILKCQNEGIRQVPEPWNGNIRTAKILFLSSNPSIGYDEKYPTFDDEKGKLSKDWGEKEVIDYFVNRFSKEHRYVKDYLYPKKDGDENSGYMTGFVRFWAAVRSMATVIIGRPAIPGDDYAIAEIVRCKSKAERGVIAATDECINNYLDRTIELSGAKIIVCLGEKVRPKVYYKYKPIIISQKSDDKENEIWEMQFNGRKIMLLFLPHPNAHKERNISKLFGDKLHLITKALQ